MKGFTLVELVIVIAIVIVLSVVSVPIYRSYVDKAKMTEGYSLLGTILTAQKTYYAEYGNFYHQYGDTDFTDYSSVLGVDARGNKYFTLFASGSGSNKDLKNHFQAYLVKPTELITDSHKTYLQLHYYLDRGAILSEGYQW